MAAVDGVLAAPSLSERLADLERCRELSQISEEEYAELRARTLHAFAPSSLTAPAAIAAGSAKKSPVQLGRDDSARFCSLPGFIATPEPGTAGLVVAADGGKVKPLAAHDRSREETYETEYDGRSNANFWCQAVAHRLASSGTATTFGVDKVNVNELCDVTSHWIRSMYAEADTDDDGHISSEELIRLLTAHNFVGLSTAHAENMIKHVGLCRGADGAKSRKIDFRQFKAVFKWLRLAELFTPTHGLFQWCQKSNEPMSKLLVHDYNRMVSLRVAPQSEEELQDFFFATQRMVNASNSAAAASDGRGVRWVHVDATAGLDRLMLLRLAVKYHLHPLVIQDVYDNRTETKIDRYEDNYFISLDILALAKEDPRSPGERRGANQRQKQTNDKASGSVKDKAPPRPVRVHRSHVCISLAGPPHWDTILTIHQERADESSWLSSWRGIDHLSDAEPVNDIWVALKSEVEAEPPHRLRSERSDFILYCILRHVVSELRPIAEAYARRLGYMRNLPTQRLPQALLDELSSVQFELVDLSRSIRPMRPTVRKLINDTALSSTARMYLEDVEDALEEMNEDLNQLLAMATSVADDDQKGRDKRMNDTLFVLSIISGIFLPGQFITGLYGMNFVDANGDPNMPELTWEWGYVYFWILQFVALTVAVTSVVFVSLRAGGDKSWKRFFSCCSFSCCGCCCCRRLAETPTKASDES